VEGNNPPPPISTFQEYGLHPIVRQNIDRCGYTKLTPVQKYAIPIVLNKFDLIACGQTSSGTTAAFLMPIIHQFLVSGIVSSLILEENCGAGERAERVRGS